MRQTHQRQGVLSAIGEERSPQGLAALLAHPLTRVIVPGRREIRSLRHETVLHLVESRIVEIGGDRRQHRLQRVRAAETGVPVVCACDLIEVDESLGDRRQRLGKILETRAQTTQHRALVVRVRHDRPLVAERQQEVLCAGAHRRFAADVEELGVPEGAGGVLIVARPLKRQLLVRPRAGPDRHGEPDRLEVEVEPRPTERRYLRMRGGGEVVGGRAVLRRRAAGAHREQPARLRLLRAAPGEERAIERSAALRSRGDRRQRVGEHHLEAGDPARHLRHEVADLPRDLDLTEEAVVVAFASVDEA